MPDFFATMDPEETNARLAFIPVQRIHWLDEGKIKPWVPGVAGKRDPVTLKMLWTTDDTQKIYVKFFGHGFSYTILGLIKSDVHLVSSADPEKARPGLSAGHGPSGAGSMVTAGLCHPHLHDDWHDLGDLERGAGFAAGRHFRLFWRLDR